MIRAITEVMFDEDQKYVEMYGLSTDSKPISGLVTGSVFVEVDTSDSYLFDEVSSEWHKVGVSIE